MPAPAPAPSPHARGGSKGVAPPRLRGRSVLGGGAPRLYPNECVEEVVAGVPRGHRHLRLALRLRDGTVIILHEAAVAAIVRAYVDIVTHPKRRAVRLLSTRLGDRKPGYAEWQLLEAELDDKALERLERLLAEAEVPEACLTSRDARG